MSDTAVVYPRETAMMRLHHYSMHMNNSSSSSLGVVRTTMMMCDSNMIDESTNEDNDMDLSSVSVGLDDSDFRRSNALHVKTSNAFLDFLKPPRYKNDDDDDDDDQDNTDPTDSCSCSFYDDDDEEDYMIVSNSSNNNNSNTADQDLLGLSIEQQQQHRRVTFGTVQVREFACTVGDHPMCRDHCPITLDWDYVDSTAEPYPLDTFECKRFFFRRHSPRRMDLEQRRDRIAETSDISEASLLELEKQQQQQEQQQSVLETKQQWKIGNLDDEEEESLNEQQKRQPHPCSREIIDWQ